MPISIKNPETEALARELASLEHSSLTDAIHGALQVRLQQVRPGHRSPSLIENVRAITGHYAQLPRLTEASDDEILGYDELGLPSR